MQTTRGTSCLPRAKKGLLPLRCAQMVLGLCVSLLLSGHAFAQYGGMGGGTAGTGSTGPGYVPPKGGYGGSGAAIGAGVGAAAGAGVLFLALHHRGAVTGCVRRTDDGFNLVDEKKNKSYALVPGSLDLKPGERVQLSGKKSNDGNGLMSFQARKVVKDFGACSEAPQASAAH